MEAIKTRFKIGIKKDLSEDECKVIMVAISDAIPDELMPFVMEMKVEKTCIEINVDVK